MEKVEKETYAIGQRIDKFCEVCAEDRGHVVALVTKKGQISRVSCPKCGTRSTFKSGAGLSGEHSSTKAGALYDRTYTYRKGQTMTHPTYGIGEVMAIGRTFEETVQKAARMLNIRYDGVIRRFVVEDDLDVLKARLSDEGAVLIDPSRPTPFERFFFREPVNGYVFEVIDLASAAGQPRASHFDQ